MVQIKSIGVPGSVLFGACTTAPFLTSSDYFCGAQGKHESLSEILDPKYQPWANTGPRKAYYEGY
jgi:ABC-type cobalt transport system substrate-binding protein